MSANSPDPGTTFSAKYCRMCALALKQGVFIFGEEGKRLQIPEKIRKTVSILVLEEDSLPKKICTDCCSSLEVYSKYKDTVLDAQEKLSAIARSLERTLEQQNLLQLQVQHQQLILQNSLKSRNAPLTPPTVAVKAASNNSNIDVEHEAEVFDSSDYPTQEDPGDDGGEIELNNEHGDGEVFDSTSGPVDKPLEIEDKEPAEKIPRLELLTSEKNSNIQTPLKVNKSAGKVESSSFSLKSPQKGNSDEDKDDEAEDISSDDSLLCGICGDSVENRSELVDHHKKSHDLKENPKPVFGCPMCPRISENYNGIRNHIYRHKKEGSFQCPDCERTFPLKDQLDRHVLASHNSKSFCCKLCDKRYAAKCSLTIHINLKHPPISEESLQEEVINGDKAVDGKSGGTSDDQSKKSSETPSSSSKTDKTTSNNKEIVTEQRENVAEDGIWKCEYCDKIFKTIGGYQGHVATHRGKRFACEHCNLSFKQKASLKHHVIMQHEKVPKQFLCEVCSKKFSTSKLLRMHKRFHADSQSEVKCLVCQKVYKTEAHMKSHMKTHRNTKNFICSRPNCGKTFSAQKKLSDHENTHTGARPYKCTFCDYTASHTGNFYKHKKQHQIEAAEKSSEEQQLPTSSSLSAPVHTIVNVPVPIINESLSKSPKKIYNNQNSATALEEQVFVTISIPEPNQSHGQNASFNSQNNTQSQNLTTNSSVAETPSSHSYSSSQHTVWVNTSTGTTNSSSSNPIQIPSTRSYQQHSQGSSSQAGMNGMDLIDCASHHTLSNNDHHPLPAPQSHQASQNHHVVHSYAPSQSQSQNLSHSSTLSQIHSHVPQHFIGSSSLSMNPPVSNPSNSSVTFHTSYSQPHQSEPMELSYKLHLDSSSFQDMPMELTKVFQRDPLELCVRHDFNPLMDLSSRVGGSDPNGMHMHSMGLSSNNNNNPISNLGIYHKLDMNERELSFNDLSGAFRQPIDLIARAEDSSQELCSEGNLVDLSLRSSFVHDQSPSSFLRELIDLSARSDSFHGELNLTNKHHHPQNQHHSHLQHANHPNLHTTNLNKHSSGVHGQTNQHHGNSSGTLQNVIYQDAMFSLQN